MKTNPLISIITVVYNGKKYLEETILSVINQSYDNIEYIIIDGGSTDGTLDIIKKYEDKIAYWVSEKDKGIYDAMNKGSLAANGEFINFMNAGDCFYRDDVLEEIFRDESCQDKCIFGKAISTYENQTFIRYESFDLQNPKWYESLQPSHQAIFFPKKLYNQITFNIELKIAADVDYIKRMLAFGYCYQDIIVADFEFGGISTYFRNFKDLRNVLHDIDIIYKTELSKRIKFYILNVIKFSMQRLLGEKRYLHYYTFYLARHYR